MEAQESRSHSKWLVFGPVVVFACLVALALVLIQPGSARLEVDQKSEFSHIRIRRQGNVRTLTFARDDGREVVESRLNLDAPHELMLAYSRTMFASYLFKPHPTRVLVVGLGGGSMVQFLKHHEPDLLVDAVEIDPVVVDLADRYFDVRSQGNVRIMTTDAFDYLRDTLERYNVIYMDAFLKPSADTDRTGVPQRLKTIAFYKSIQEKLTPDGLVVFNLNPHAGTEDDIRTIESAFAQTAVFRCSGSRNLVAVASIAATSPEPAVLEARAVELDERFKANFSFRELLNDRKD